MDRVEEKEKGQSEITIILLLHKSNNINIHVFFQNIKYTLYIKSSSKTSDLRGKEK